MRPVVIACGLLLFGMGQALGQGQFVFNNRILPDIDAPVEVNDDSSSCHLAGTDWGVQLLGGAMGVPYSSTRPLAPSGTTFRADAPGYVNPITVTVPGVAAGQYADVFVRVFKVTDASPGNDRVAGPFTVSLGGGIVPPPNLPLGVGSLDLCVPEPSATGLALIGVGVLTWVVLSKRKGKKDGWPEGRV